MSEDPLKYLQQDDIGKVIAKGLATLYTQKPQKPVKYLAEWLKSFSKNKKQLAKIVSSQQIKKDSLKLFQQSNKINTTILEESKKQQKLKDSKIDDFKNMVANHEYQQQLLEEVLPQFIQKHTKITGAYIGQLNHPPRQVTDEDTDEQAHLNTGADKVINYIGSSVSHKGLMRGKILKLNQGVTNNAFALVEEAKEPAVGEDGQQVPQVKKEKYVYIPNVVKNQSMHYFKIPKLGAYLAVPLVCQSYLTQKIFDEALASKKKQIAEQDQFLKKQHDELEQLNKNKQELDKKVHDMRQKHVDQAQIQPISNQLSELVKKIAQKQQQKYVSEQSPLTVSKNSYVVCVDNLGKDQQLDPKDIALITNLIQHFKNSWETKQKQLLAKDIETEIQQLRSLPSAPENIKLQLQKTTILDEQLAKQINDIENQKLRAYKLQEEQLKKLKAEIKDNKIFLEAFLNIKQFRVVKFKQVIQNILFFLGETKDKINIPKKAILNWKNVRQHYITKETFNKILNYIVQGPKQTAFKFYGKTPLLLDIFQKFNEDQIFAYNVGLGALVKFIKKALKHRVSNVQLRKSQKQVEREEREALIKQNEKIDAQKLADLDQHKKGLLPQQFQAFKEQQWVGKYDTEYPKKQVPPEIVDDVDNDM